MATDLERLVVQLSADVRQYQNAMNRAQGLTNKRARAIENRFREMNRNVSASFQSMLSSSVATIGGVLGVAEIAKYADAWTEAGNKIGAAGQAAGVQTRSLAEIAAGAKDARAALGDYADLYARLIRSASGVAKSEQEIATATNIVAKAFKAGGAGAQEQAAGILQLGQALGSGVLQGDELRSLRENAPILADAIAKEFNVTLAELKQLGADGKLTADRVFRAILNAQSDIEAQFSKTNATIADGFLNLSNSLTQYIGQAAEAYGVTETINGVLAALAGNIGSVANAAAAAGAVLLATFGRGAALAAVGALANPFVALAAAVGAAAFAVTNLWDQIVPLQGSFATLGDYAQAMWQALSDGAAATSAFVADQFRELTDRIGAALASAGTSFSDLGEIAQAFINSTIESFVRWKDIIVATFTLLPSAIGEAVVGAMNSMIAGVEDGINKVIAAVNAAIGAINSLSDFAGVSPIGAIGSVELGRIENSYAGAGAKAADAFYDALTRPSADYVGMAGDAVANTVSAITAKANELARARREQQKDADLDPTAGKPKSAITQGFGGDIGKPPSGAGGGGSRGKGRGGSRGNDYEREIEHIKERTAALQAETAAQATVNPLIDDYGFAAERAATAQDLLSAAKEAGVAAGKELSGVQQLLAGDFSNLSPKAREQAEAMLKLAGDMATATAESRKLEEQQDKIRESAEEWASLGKDVTKGFIQDLIDGKSAAEALTNALQKVADKLLNEVLDAIFQVNGAGGGGGGIFGNLLGSFFGGGSSAFPPAPAVGLFDKGGYTGAGGKHDPAGVVHKGEYVFDQDSVRAAGGPGALDEMRRRLRGYSAGGLVGAPAVPHVSLPRLNSSSGSLAGGAMKVDVGVSVDDDGNLKAYVKGISRQESTSAVRTGIDAFSKRQLPYRLQQINANPRKIG